MKAAVATAIAEVQDDIDRIQRKVQERTEEIANNTYEALKTIDSNLASELTPVLHHQRQQMDRVIFS